MDCCPYFMKHAKCICYFQKVCRSKIKRSVSKHNNSGMDQWDQWVLPQLPQHVRNQLMAYNMNTDAHSYQQF